MLQQSLIMLHLIDFCIKQAFFAAYDAYIEYIS